MFVKICGLRTEAAVAAAVAQGCDAIGLVLTDSVRQISPERARELAAGIPGSIAAVAVFRDEDVATMVQRATAAAVGWVQIHGSRTIEEVSQLKAAGFKVIRATRGTDPDEVFTPWGEDLLLVDAAVPGSGEAWDYAGIAPRLAGRRWLLAGGLSPQNVAQALEASGAGGADVSSGVESSRGVKDLEKIAQFIQAARTVQPGS